MNVLVTGATGYVGGRLIPRLLEAGHAVRVLVRDAKRLEGRAWADDVDVVEGDILGAPADLCKGMDAAYYLVHSMTGHRDFEARDAAAAKHFASLAAGVKHVIYLGGLQPDAPASAHLGSRAEVGQILAEALPVTEFRAGPIIGSGSASFEMVRYLTERLPVMVTPKWVHNEVQPVAIRDVLSYLVAALEAGPQGVVDIGADRLPFSGMMQGYAKARGLRRTIIPVPVLAPTLAGRWVQLVTPIPNTLAVPLLAGIVHPVVADTTKAEKLFPHIAPISFEQAVGLAIDRTDLDDVETRWCGAHTSDYEVTDWQNLVQEERSIHVAAPPERVFEEVLRIGGDDGYPAWQWAWRIRGAVDRIVGGPGLRRGKRSRTPRVGDAIDFWRVEELVPHQLLRLRSEMRMPGRAWLQYEVVAEDGGTRLVQTAFYEPRGLGGVVYWKALYPVHWFLFRDMARALGRRA